MKKLIFSLGTAVLMTLNVVSAQTNVYDDVIATSPDHTYLKAALDQQGLDAALQNDAATLTVFAPTNDAFDALAAALNTDIAGILANPDLTGILTYHVLGTTVLSSGITSGMTPTPLNTDNTLKLSVTQASEVFVNQAQVTTADLSTDNGVVHVIDKVLLPDPTVVDIAINGGFTHLVTAVVQQDLLHVLSDPLATFTVFAPSNEAFEDLADELGTDLAGVLELPFLTDVLLYHVMEGFVGSSSISNGGQVNAINDEFFLKLTVTSDDLVYVNQAQVETADLNTSNGVVHAIDAVLLPFETIADAAIANGLTSLYAAMSVAELIPLASDPFVLYTAFAPTNEAFDNLATALNTDLDGVLANPELENILLYHVLEDEYLSGDLVNGTVQTVLGGNVTISVGPPVMVNTAEVINPDVTVFNGVVHVIDEVLLPPTASIDEAKPMYSIYPNPAQDQIYVLGEDAEFSLSNASGQIVMENLKSNQYIDISKLENGIYFITIDRVTYKIAKF